MFEVFTLSKIQVKIFWFVTSCSFLPIEGGGMEL